MTECHLLSRPVAHALIQIRAWRQRSEVIQDLCAEASPSRENRFPHRQRAPEARRGDIETNQADVHGTGS